MRKSGGDLQQDFFFVEEKDQTRIVNFVLSLCQGGIKKFQGYEEFKNIQIITPSKKGLCGTRELNQKIQGLMNQAENGKKEKAIRTDYFSRRR